MSQSISEVVSRGIFNDTKANVGSYAYEHAYYAHSITAVLGFEEEMKV